MKKILMLLVLAVGCRAQTAVQSCTGVAFSNNTNACSFGSPPTVGNTIVVGVSGNNSTGGCTDNQSNTYTKQFTDAGALAKVEVFTAPVSTSSGTFTVTCGTVGFTYYTMLATEFSGLNNASIFDSSASGAENTTSPFDCGTITTTNASDMLFSVLENSTGASTTFGAGSGFAIATSVGIAASIESATQYKSLSSTISGSAITMTSNLNGATEICGTVALKRSGGGAPAPHGLPTLGAGHSE